jgi:hypothetical protein
MSEMDQALSIRDKVLAEFILNLAKRSTSVMHFEQLLEENEADFSIELISTMYALITKMLPEHFKRKPTHFRVAEQLPEEVFQKQPDS